MATTNKEELVTVVAGIMESTKKDARKAIDAVVEGIRSELKAGNDVNLVGFTKYTQVLVPAHERKLGFTGETIQVPEKIKYKAKVSKAL